MVATVHLNELDETLPTGVARLSLITLDVEETMTLMGTILMPNGVTVPLELEYVAEESEVDTNEDKPKGKPDATSGEEPDDEAEVDSTEEKICRRN